MIVSLDITAGCTRFFTYCRYYDVTKTVNCSNINIGSLQVQDPSVDSVKVECLHLRSSRLTTLEADVFTSVPKVWYLDISNNFLETLDYRLFRKLKRLLHLDLTDNKLISLHDERLFKAQGRLSSLLLGNNKLNSLNVIVLRPLKSIRVLKLTGNPFVCNCELRLTMLWCTERDLDTNATCKHPPTFTASPWSVLNSSDICDTVRTSIVDTSETGMTLKETEEMPTTEKNAKVSITEGNAELSTEGNGEVPTTDEIAEISTTEGSAKVSTTEGDDEVSATEGGGELPTTEGESDVPTEEGNVEMSTTEGDAEWSSVSSGTFVTALTASACVAVLAVCFVTSVFCWRKLRAADRSENTHSVKLEDKLNDNDMKADPSAQGMVPLFLQPDYPLRNEAIMNTEIEPLQSNPSETDVEGTRL